MLFSLFDSDFEFTPLPNAQNLFQSPAPAIFQIFSILGPAFTRYYQYFVIDVHRLSTYPQFPILAYWVS